MGSRMMHLSIAAQLLSRLPHMDECLLLGGIAPDANQYIGIPKGATHYYDRTETGLIYVNAERFYAEHRQWMKEPFLIGYYSHLLSDQIWLDDFYYRKIKWLPPARKKEAQQRNYRDFGRLNGRLAEAYGLAYRYLEPPEGGFGELTAEALQRLQLELRDDFIADPAKRNEELELHTFEEVKAYVDRCVAFCLQALREKGVVPECEPH
ncbi:hypothetical protein J31TS4_10300 [Paenibacillus sp. J31TS4]|uniref:zinc dependent phospholipase C family protein n=1 Tax=Paenibacillus sp. J31TS4 TaxID=2807195 RepID=UPI001AFED6A2|nr:zinc dependent phospholipase C family protein [Paenibacillus sp. J31TS4]GIP37750.1 hypothetical protein J31TS4_10300 [Paenibacillus sp. J31TS4]